jgi:hypothetical protein
MQASCWARLRTISRSGQEARSPLCNQDLAKNPVLFLQICPDVPIIIVLRQLAVASRDAGTLTSLSELSSDAGVRCVECGAEQTVRLPLK